MDMDYFLIDLHCPDCYRKGLGGGFIYSGLHRCDDHIKAHCGECGVTFHIQLCRAGTQVLHRSKE